MSAIESKIDELYQQPLGEFIAARTALAKTLSGADASRVRALRKPTVVPWAVNLLYWHARATFDRLRKAGEKLRAAQIATLKGREADVRAASEAHRKAIADAATHAAALAARAGSKPDADELTRTLEALSIASDLSEPPGRMTLALRPAGFEALASLAQGGHLKLQTKNTFTAKTTKITTITRVEQREKREKEEAKRKDEARQRAEIDAEAARDRAAADESQTRKAWERAKSALEAADRRLEKVRSGG